MTTLTHPGLLTLRRLIAGEAVDAAVRDHLDQCPVCRGRVDELNDEQRRFEAAVPFERFIEGVARAAEARPTTRGRRLLQVGRWAAAVAAMAVLGVTGHAVLTQRASIESRRKGGSSVEVVVASQKAARRMASEDPATPEALAHGDRLRIGVTPGPWHFVMVVSIDAGGAVTPVYASGSRSLALSGTSPEFLPDSLEFTGEGLEHVVVLLSDRPLEVDLVSAQLRERFSKVEGDLTRLGDLDLPAEQFHRTVRKP